MLAYTNYSYYASNASKKVSSYVQFNVTSTGSSGNFAMDTTTGSDTIFTAEFSMQHLTVQETSPPSILPAYHSWMLARSRHRSHHQDFLVQSLRKMLGFPLQQGHSLPMRYTVPIKPRTFLIQYLLIQPPVL